MSDDLVKRLRTEPNWMREDYPQSEAADALEAQSAEITRLRAERIAERSARIKAEGEFSTMQHRIARQRRALVKLYQRRHHRNALINHLIAALATARCNDMGDAWIAQKHAWQEAIEDALLQWCGAPDDDETPKDALRRLIQYEITAALDPAVSQSAADLVANARREGMEEAAKWHDEQAAEAQKLSDMKVSALDAKVWGDYATNHREYAAAIRAAAGEGKRDE